MHKKRFYSESENSLISTDEEYIYTGRNKMMKKGGSGDKDALITSNYLKLKERLLEEKLSRNFKFDSIYTSRSQMSKFEKLIQKNDMLIKELKKAKGQI